MYKMKSFSGFPAGSLNNTPLPNLFFTELLPLIDDLAELKVTLHVFWRLYHMRETHPRCVSHAQLASDTTLLRSLSELGRPPHAALEDGLQRAVARGTLVKMVPAANQQPDEQTNGENRSHTPALPGSPAQPTAWYFPNSAQGRRAVAQIQAGELALPEAGLHPEAPSVELERPNVFVLYERNVGVLTPFISEQLRDAEQTYPAEWIEEAFQIAVTHNVRKWAYVRGILQRWATEGRDDGTDRQVSKEDPDRYISGEYAEYVDH
jgi:DnaD/phage-associated family protein